MIRKTKPVQRRAGKSAGWALALVLTAALSACTTAEQGDAPQAAPAAQATTSARDAFVAGIDIRRGAGDGGALAEGHVFHDANRNGRKDAGERGVPDVKVSNGRDVVLTDAQGAYALPARNDMAVFVIQPSGWRVPTDARWVPQFSYQHKPGGSPKQLRYGGLPATGPLPEAINFPLVPSGTGDAFQCAVLGDTQVYNNNEVGYARDSLVDDLLDRGAERTDCLLAVGDVMGDDLGLIPRFAEVLGAVGAPQWWVHGNHDFDFDADDDRNSADSWRRLWGPAYYAFEMGEVLFVVLDNVVYPCGPDDNKSGTRSFCVEDDRKRYNARITDDQMAFVENLLTLTGEGKLIVFAHHIPFVSFVDQTTQPHQTDNVTALYRLVEGRKALSLSGHTHTVENLAPGDLFEGWTEQVGVTALPFRHLVAGAVSGGWWNGDYDVHGVPMSLQRQGGPRGWADLNVTGTDYTLDYRGTGLNPDTAMWLSVNTPAFRQWAAEIQFWLDQPREERDPLPPLSVQDLPDLKLLTPEDLAGRAWLTANIWAGDSTATVTVSIDGAPPVAMTRTQQAQGEAARIGPEWSDPFALQRQLTVARAAIQSRSGNEEAQGYAQGRRDRIPPAPPQPRGSRADRNMHLWIYDLPADLKPGVHTAVVTARRDQGATVTDTLVFEVRAERPPRLWRKEVWDAFENGPPVRE